MNPKLKLTAYAVLVILCACFGRGFYSNYAAATKPVPDIGSVGPAATPDDSTNANTNNATNAVAATNAAPSSDSNSVANSDTNTASSPDANAAAESTTNTNTAAMLGTNITNAAETKSSRKSTNAHPPVVQAAKIAAPAPDASAARGSMITYLAAFVGSVIGLGLLIAYDVTQIVGTQAVDFLFNDAGEGQRDPEYERAEAEWANGKFLDAIQLMRDFLKKHPREIYAALRIAEIYEKDLKNPLAAALEYEEVLKHKLPAERWGWAAIHLCNLYSRLNQSDKALALLRRVADDYPKTGAAKKARVRLGIAEPEPEVVEEAAGEAEESETMDGRPIASIEARPPELEPRQPSAPEPDAPEAAKPSLPPGFRKKK
jgi:TolA-binding protein